MPVTYCRGNNVPVYIVLLLMLLLQMGISLKKQELQYEIRKNLKNYTLVMEELERKNNCELKGE